MRLFFSSSVVFFAFLLFLRGSEPQKVVPVHPHASSDSEAYFWVLTDLHFDTEYTPGSDAYKSCHASSSSGVDVQEDEYVPSHHLRSFSSRRSHAAQKDWCAPKYEDDCETCKSLLCKADRYVDERTNETEFIEILSALCKDFPKIEDRCLAVVDKYGHALHDLFLLLDPYEICRLAGTCPHEAGAIADHFCSPPTSMVESALAMMKEIDGDNEPDFILWTGDTAPQTKAPTVNFDFLLDTLLLGSNLISKAYPSIPVYPGIGNHDCFAKDSFPLSPGPLIGNLSLLWDRYLYSSPEAVTLFELGGFYSMDLSISIRIVMLNTEILYINNPAVPVGTKDPLGQFEFLEGRIKDAALKNMKVIIAGHVPPGPNERAAVAMEEQWTSTNSQLFYDIVTKYSDVILASFWGHEHSDSIRIWKDSDGEPVSAGFIGLALTPKIVTVANNPGIRRVKYDPTGVIPYLLDIEEYTMDVVKSNHESQAIWSKEYSLIEMLKIPDLSPSSIVSAVENFSTDYEMWNDFFHANNGGVMGADGTDDDLHAHYCAIMNPIGTGFNTCIMS